MSETGGRKEDDRTRRIGAMAEFERDVIRERTQAGLEAARARGRRGDRPKAIQAIEPRNLARAKELYAAKSNTIAANDLLLERENGHQGNEHKRHSFKKKISFTPSK